MTTSLLPPLASPPRRGLKRFIPRLRISGPLLFYLLLAATAIMAVVVGLDLRKTTWQASRRVHFHSDLTNSWRWGTYVIMKPRDLGGVFTPFKPHLTFGQFFRRYVGTYQAREHTAHRHDYELDYVPGKLLANALMIWHERLLHPTARNFTQQTLKPLLYMNTATEILAAIALFLLVRYWVIRGARPPPPRAAGPVRRFVLQRFGKWYGLSARPGAPQRAAAPDPALPLRAAALGLVAALFFWLNPAVLISGHAWAQWDIQLVAWYLLAVLLASWDLFFAAGAVLFFGALFKGQLFFVAAIFVLWPLFQGRPGAAFRFLLGGIITFGLALSPWLFRPFSSWYFLASVVVAAALVTPWMFLRRRRQWYWGFALLLVVPLVLWPWWFGPAQSGLWLAALLAAAIVTLPWQLRPQHALYFNVAMVAAAIVVISVTMRGTFAWWRLSYGYGTHHYLTLSFPDTLGLQNILARRFHWGLFNTVFTLHLPGLGAVPVPMRSFMFLLFVLTLVLCAWGAARQFARNDPRFLVAMVTPWLTFFVLAPQMHERYLIWAAAMLPVALAVNAGLLWLDLFLSAATCTMMLAVMFSNNHRDWHALRTIRATEPGAGWAVLLCAAIYLYFALVTVRKVPLLRGAAVRQGLPATSRASNTALAHWTA